MPINQAPPCFFLSYIENAAHTDSIEELRNIVAFCLHFSQSYLIHEGIKSPQSMLQYSINLLDLQGVFTKMCDLRCKIFQITVSISRLDKG